MNVSAGKSQLRIGKSDAVAIGWAMYFVVDKVIGWARIDGGPNPIARKADTILINPVNFDDFMSFQKKHRGMH